VEAVADRLVEVLVNDAGVGGRGRFATERQLAADLAMIQLNVTTLVELTGLLLPSMLERDRGGILNVGSIAGLLAGPWAGGLQRHQGLPEVIQSGSQRGDAQYRRTRHRFVPWPGGQRIREGCRLSATHIEKSADESFVRRSGGRRWMAGVGCEQAGCGARSTDAGLQSLRVLPWQVIARASPGRHAVGRRLERIHAYAYFA
jgi:NAD(P)-dependent dehydrogenase (short-subunit alcohol dehydrogenase family)